MKEDDIINLIKEDVWMMRVLSQARELDLPDWMIGAGFVRNKVWDYLHGFGNTNRESFKNDIDLIYFDPNGNNEEEDKILSKKISEKTRLDWEIVNQAYTHTWHSRPPYKNSVDALSEWVETPTCVAVRLGQDGSLLLFAPHGTGDLVNLIVRPSPKNFDKNAYRERQAKKKWKEKWPKLQILY